MKERKEQILAVALFALVLVIFSLADSDTKKNERFYSGREQKSEARMIYEAVPDSAIVN